MLPFIFAASLLAVEPTAAANAAFDAYSKVVEAGLSQQTFRDRVIEHLTTPEVPGALIHHWRGTAFVPGARPADFERILRDYSAYPQTFSPQVLQTSVLSGTGDHLQVRMRIRQRHIITVVMDTTSEVTFSDGHISSKSTQITEVGPKEDRGFLWRLNSFWTYAERDGGLYLQLDAVSLSRSIPHGLEWMIRGYVESIPRESLEFTLRSGREALERIQK